MRKCRECKSEIARRVAAPKSAEDKLLNGGFCSFDCLIAYSKKKAEQAKRRKEARQHKESLFKVRQGTKQDKTTENAQNAVNRYIRLRDAGKPCISCLEPLPVDISQFDAGHFRSRGACPELRFVDMNIHGQCRICNGGSKNQNARLRNSETITENYERNLRDRIGDEIVDWLKGSHEPTRYRYDDLLYLSKVYRRLNKFIEKERVLT